MLLELNIKGLCKTNGIEFDDFLADLDADNVFELSIYDLEAICEEYEIDLQALLFKPLFSQASLDKKIKGLKMLTDGGMYVSEKGDQMKRYNTHDGLALLELSKSKKLELGIISSGFTEHMVQDRAALLGIERVYVGREPKLSILENWCKEMNISPKEVAFIGDDRNDTEVMKAVGLAVCPASAVASIKSISDIVLSRKGGAACVREFIDNYLS
jgi:YrbI family 3-deoxy-D-manno-octulosonate 8-phosphate phosphatase